MKRLVEGFAEPFDLLVVGGGIHGALASWIATQNGLRVALLEQQDFCSGASNHSQRIIHGGLRYLQQADFPRIIESLQSRHFFRQLSPRLITKLENILPLYEGEHVKNLSMGLAVRMYSWLDQLINSFQSSFPSGKHLSYQELVGTLPPSRRHDLIGGGQWFDGFCKHPSRLVIELLESASGRGAQVANYCQAKGIRRDGNTNELICAAYDKFTKQEFVIRTRKVLSCTGAWGTEWIQSCGKERPLVRAMALVVKSKRKVHRATGYKSRSGQLLFHVPWDQSSFSLGTVYFPYRSHHAEEPKRYGHVDKEDQRKGLDLFWREAGSILEDLGVNRRETHQVVTGVLPADMSKPKPWPSGRHHLRPMFGLEGDAISLESVKFTTAPILCLRAIRQLFQNRSVTLPHGSLEEGSTRDQESSLRKLIDDHQEIPKSVIENLFGQFGSQAKKVFHSLSCVQSKEDSQMTLLDQAIRHTVENEMACCQEDVLLRRINDWEILSKGASHPELSQRIQRVLEMNKGTEL
ncbi:MAG: FAD-dependent oxidoreductase [Okeania sp. SIO1H5]|uniref:FAD-dependent oxidoreductase n=1 Tax=Okeania sp. SIO1H5 TaxID=2607777 RepID=UPI0013B74BEA|nr:FAD-dependent oxidoreductase [Okeania sp. SIO1H5]NET23690.1 FAD-dependent oxidoreductase [Okeania sp. SIO1H5]